MTDEDERRLRKRERRGDSVSDATWELARREHEILPTCNDIPTQCHVINTEQDIDEALEAVKKRIAEGKH